MNKKQPVLKKGVVISEPFILIMSTVIIILAIALVILFNIDVFTNVSEGQRNMQYSTDAGRELYAIMASDCDTGIVNYENYNVEDLISVYVSGTQEVKEDIDASLRGCITAALVTIADVNKGKDKDGNNIDHCMYFYVTYNSQKYLELRRPGITYDKEKDTLIPWVENVVTTTGLDWAITHYPAGGTSSSIVSLPVNPRYFKETINDISKIRVPLADDGNMQYSSATAVLEEWSNEPWSTLTPLQQQEEYDYDW